MKRKKPSSSSVLFLNEDGRESRSMCLSSEFCDQEDIVEEILLRLQVKPLHRCMSLSKSVRSLISSNYFHQKYRKYRMGGADSKILMGFFNERINLDSCNLPVELGFVPTSSEGERLIEQGFDTSLSFLDRSTNDGFDATSRFDLVASSGALLLCRKDWFSSLRPFIHCEYYICNPVTRQIITLPKPPDMILGAVFETFTCCGDDYPCLDWVTYKVVCGSSTSDGNLHVEIFSSNTGQWVALQLSTPFSSWMRSVTSVMNESETVCLVAFPRKIGDYLDSCWLVFNAKQNTNELHIVKSPRPEYDLMHTKLAQSQGFIYMTSTESAGIELWELNEDKKIWVLKYSINQVEMFSQIFEKTPYFLGLDPSNSALVLVVVDTMIALVDVKKKSFVYTSNYPDCLARFLWYPSQPVPYWYPINKL